METRLVPTMLSLRTHNPHDRDAIRSMMHAPANCPTIPRRVPWWGQPDSTAFGRTHTQIRIRREGSYTDQAFAELLKACLHFGRLLGDLLVAKLHEAVDENLPKDGGEGACRCEVVKVHDAHALGGSRKPGTRGRRAVIIRKSSRVRGTAKLGDHRSLCRSETRSYHTGPRPSGREDARAPRWGAIFRPPSPSFVKVSYLPLRIGVWCGSFVRKRDTQKTTHRCVTQHSPSTLPGWLVRLQVWPLAPEVVAAGAAAGALPSRRHPHRRQRRVQVAAAQLRGVEAAVWAVPEGEDREWWGRGGAEAGVQPLPRSRRLRTREGRG